MDIASSCYLLILFKYSYIDNIAKHELYKKALKACFKLRKDFLSFNPVVHSSIHIFDHTIKPILLYGSEIWGTFNVNNHRFPKMIQPTS